MSRHFKLDAELVDQIIFAMENQYSTFLLNSKTLELISDDSQEPEDEGEEDLVSLPEWNPSDGYQLMDSFTAGLNNPVFKERLRNIMNSGKGVFRRFKDVLREREDLEKLWYAYKERGMKKRVWEWYEELCEFWGVESLGREPEEIDDLFLDNFTIQEYPRDSEELTAANDAMRKALYKSFPESLKDVLLDPFLGKKDADAAFHALSPDGTGRGIIAIKLQGEGGSHGFINCLYVEPEFRGAGIASGLLDRTCRHCYDKGVKKILISLPPEGEILKENLARRGFIALGPWLILDLETWHYSQMDSI